MKKEPANDLIHSVHYLEGERMLHSAKTSMLFFAA